jgi:hypothetical protein
LLVVGCWLLFVVCCLLIVVARCRIHNYLYSWELRGTSQAFFSHSGCFKIIKDFPSSQFPLDKT